LTEEPPTKIGRYEIRRELGRGMMGVVYEAYDPALSRRIALKTIQLAFAVSEEERRSFEERFLTEARVAARLSHPGIVVVHDVGQDEDTGTLFIALEYLDGRTLEEILRGEQFIAWQEALRITRGVAEALHQAHSQGVIHRDIKPANIMILDSGEPKIMDFGIAKVESSHITSAGQSFGTPLYMSPEQLLGRPLDARSDLFSLGTLAYGLLTGQKAFGDASLPRIVARVIHEDPVPPTLVVRGLPPDTDYLIARALAKEPASRYPDGKALAEDASDILAIRPPRHKEGWTQPPSAAQVKADPSTGEAPTIDLHAELERLVADAPSPCIKVGAPGRSATPQRRTARRVLRWTATIAASALVAGAIVGGLMLTRSRSEIGASLAATPPAPEAAATPEAAPTAVEAAPTAVGAARTPKAPPAAPSKAVPKARRRIRAPSEVTPAAVPLSRLAVAFEHSLKTGTLRIWVDHALVFDGTLNEKVKKIVKVDLSVSPGLHDVTLQVTWDGNVKTKTIAGHFTSGRVRRASARLGGLLKKDLKLEWD
jgi:eukaryotic-like serine/threonine-protein kinase